MKIISITIVKNEADIIESFIRYHLNIFDEMLILDNGSADETLLIINNLIREGLSVNLIESSDAYHVQDIKMTKLLHQAVNEHSGDIVCLLDADEFIISDNGQNPREIIKKINENYYYLIKWITYVPTNNDDYNIKFIPKRITHVRDESLEQYYKVIVPKKVVNDFNVRVEMGNHNLKFDNFNRNELVKKDLNLKIAHFPLRSIEQCISKVSIGWPNIIAINLYNLSWGFHWKMLFDKIKEENDISLDDLEFFAKNYALVSTSDDILIKNQPINLDFCDKIEIRYDFEYNYLRNILENYAYFAEEIVSFKRKLKSVPILDDRFILKLASDYDVIEKSGLFDVNWYCKRYSPPRNIHPIIHYLLTYRENMNDPAGFFSTEYYFKTHVDVANSGMNPFVHYIKYGKKENRKIASSKSENFGVQ